MTKQIICLRVLDKTKWFTWLVWHFLLSSVLNQAKIIINYEREWMPNPSKKETLQAIVGVNGMVFERRIFCDIK